MLSCPHNTSAHLSGASKILGFSLYWQSSPLLNSISYSQLQYEMMKLRHLMDHELRTKLCRMVYFCLILKQFKIDILVLHEQLN